MKELFVKNTQCCTSSLMRKLLVKHQQLPYAIAASLLISACGGGGSDTPPVTKPVTSTPAPVEAMTVSGLTDNSLVAANDNIAITAKSADLSKATLVLNDVEISTINTAPFEFNATNTSQLADLPIGHHKVQVKGMVDNKEQTIDLSFKQDGEYLATYAAVNYVYDNAPYEAGSITGINVINLRFICLFTMS